MTDNVRKLALAQAVLSGPIDNGGSFEARVDAMAKRANEVTAEVVALAIEGLELTFGDGTEGSTGDNNATRLLYLQNALPKSLRKVEFANWIGTVSPAFLSKVDPKTGNASKVNVLKPGEKFFHPLNLELAKATPWYEKPEIVKPVNVNFTLLASIKSQLGAWLKTLNDDPKAKPLPTGTSKAELATLVIGLQNDAHKLGVFEMLDASHKVKVRREDYEIAA